MLNQVQHDKLRQRSAHAPSSDMPLTPGGLRNLLHMEMKGWRQRLRRASPSEHVDPKLHQLPIVWT